MNTPDCSLPREEIVAWQEGVLEPAREAELTVHIGQCPVCQRQLKESDDVSRIFRENWPLVTDPQGEAHVIGQVYGLENRGWLPRLCPGRGRTQKILALAAPVLVLVLLSAIFWPAPLQATGTTLSSLLHYAEHRVNGTVLDRDDLPGKRVRGITSDPALVVPTELPLELEIVGLERREDERLDVQYEDGSNLTILLSEAPSDKADITFSAGTALHATVENHEVFWLEGPRPETVSAMMWERNDVTFSVMVLEGPQAPDAGLPLVDALTIVESIMQQQDATREGDG